jgi:DNA repair protein RecN (Recombination protein N)
MLVQLTISNFAIINYLEIHFKPGLNVLSGETGAGKSIIINAVNLILGGRASADLIRTGEDEAKVEALFILPEGSGARDLLSKLGLIFQEELVIKRHISREGRNRIMINDSMVTLQILSRIGVALMSISGQHENQMLLKPDNHLYMLDDFGTLTEERLSLNALFDRYQALKGDRRKLESEVREREERQDLAAFQRDEIERADLRRGEDDLLEAEKRRLVHSEQLREIVRETYEILYEEEGSVISRLGACLRRLEKGSEMDDTLKPVAKVLGSVKIEVEESAVELREMQRDIAADPRRLEQVEDRLQLIAKLKRKYGPSIEAILQIKEKLSHLMSDLEEKREILKEINNKVSELEKQILVRAAHLSRKRKQAAENFEEALSTELALLGMAGTRFEVGFNAQASRQGIESLNSDGMDGVEFMISSNVGEDLKPLSRTASGGELSRLTLALKTILARTASVETIVFDEVDSGIGGATAEMVGEKLRSLARFHQILCITHLPQIASKGSTHFAVRKKVAEGRTGTIISELNREERVKEIARLLGGKTVSQKAIAHAREMLS